MSSPYILPQFQGLYNWQVDTAPQFIAIVATLPDGIASKDLSVTATDNSVICAFPGLLPFVAGRVSPALDPRPIVQVVERNLLIQFERRQPGDVPTPIVGPTPSGALDPRSALRLACECRISGDLVGYWDFLKWSLNARLPEAMLTKALELARLEGDHNQEIAELLRIACDDYDYDMAFEQRAVLAFTRGEYEQAAADFKRAADKGSVNARICLGEIYSPVEGPKTGLEDAERAMDCFQQVLEVVDSHPFALYNIGKLYFYGAGVPKDEARGVELYAKARSISSEVPNVDELESAAVRMRVRVAREKQKMEREKEADDVKKKVLVFATATAVTGLALWRFFRKRR